MVNLFKTHITTLEKVRNALSSPSTNMSGSLAINNIMTRDDYERRTLALEHIKTAIVIL